MDQLLAIPRLIERSLEIFLKEGTMSKYARVIPPIEKPSALQLAIREWQRELVERKIQQRLAVGSGTG